MKLKHLYLICCVIGLVLPFSQFIPWLMNHGLDSSLFIHDLFSNRIGGFFALDVLVSAVVLFIFVRIESMRLGIRGWWLPLVGTLAVGVSFGLPLFLFMRQVHLDQVQA